MTEENKLWFEYGKALGRYLFARNDVILEIKINKEDVRLKNMGIICRELKGKVV